MMNHIRRIRYSIAAIIFLIAFTGIYFVLQTRKAKHTDAQQPDSLAVKTSRLASGLSLFSQHCSRCHAARKEEAELGGITFFRDHFPEDVKLRAFIRNSQAMVRAGDTVAVKLWERNGKAVMDSFPQLADAEINQIIEYMDSYLSNRRKP